MKKKTKKIKESKKVKPLTITLIYLMWIYMGIWSLYNTEKEETQKPEIVIYLEERSN